MGYMHDQDYHAQTNRARVQPGEDQERPPPPYIEGTTQAESEALDDRPSFLETPACHQASTESRRTLLLVYIHGFMGDEASFQSFPTHIHESISAKLSTTHMVRSIVYPKYKTRKKINVARDEFSVWLQQQESGRTDIILLGHSMGGLLAAEVALLPPEHGSRGYRRHRLLGTINFDTPFLGMHPGIILSGISSPFRSAPEATTVPESTLLAQGINSPRDKSDAGLPSHVSLPTSSDDNIAEHHDSSGSGSSASLNPHEKHNDLPCTSASSQSSWSRAFYFINKHYSDGLTKAVKAYVASHVEFGKCLADHDGLMNRYTQTRGLEDDRNWRTRFVNYYTASSGRPKAKKKDKAAKNRKNDAEPSRSSSSTELTKHALQDLAMSESKDEYIDPTPATSTEAGDDVAPTKNEALQQQATNEASMNPHHDESQDEPEAISTDLQSIPVHPSSSESSSTITPKPHPDQKLDSDQASAANLETTNLLPPIPERPPSPTPFDPSIYPDKVTLKLASRAHDRDVKIYKRLLKTRDDAIADRRKALAKQAKAASTEQKSKKSKIETLPTMPHSDKDLADVGNRKVSAPAPSQSTMPVHTAGYQDPESVPKQQKLHTFCLLPSKPDPCWVRVIMRDMDEVTAHCALFAAEGHHYRGFVRDVVERIQGWVEEKEEIGG
ncbi:MAG: hypothetical protein Q9222_006325 [Ikaeria aurantiellina]